MSLFRNLHALQPDTTTDHPTVVTEKLRAMFSAPTQADRDTNIAVHKTVFSELQQEEYREPSELVTAYVDQYVPIPYAHGDQSVSG